MSLDLACADLKYKTTNWTADYSVAFRHSHWHVISGSSGSGKSTLLRLISGLLTPESGHVLLGEKCLSPLPPHLRGISFMGQSNLLFPGISILENLLLALHDQAETRHQKIARIKDLAVSLNLDQMLLERLPIQVSGGELSRFNLARALLRKCSWLLLDEPFGAVDRETRLDIISWLKQWQKASSAGIILVSHDLDDIFTAATDLTVIADGKILESAPLAQAIDTPTNLTTARLLRSGLIMREPTGFRFVRSQDIFTSPGTSRRDPRYLASFTLKAPQATRIGAVLRVIDLTEGSDFTVPWDPDFTGTVWFDRRHVHNLTSG